MDDTHKALAEYRLEKAMSCIEASQIAYSNKCYEASLNRSYYAIFHSIRAILALDGVDRKKHSGVIVMSVKCRVNISRNATGIR